ncbi:MAG: encapsulin, partial [Armatimonadetes bacterium]|nr:encapsulin [Armatimonadota bacterium]
MWSAHQKLTELPLMADQAAGVLQAAVQEVRRTVVARRLIALFGPLGAGVESVPLETIRKDEAAEIDLEGSPDPHPIGAHEKQEYVRVPLIYKDFILHWRDVKGSQDMGTPLDGTNAMRAAHQVGHAEDKLLFNGSSELGVYGLLNWPGSLQVQADDWKNPGVPVKNVYGAIRRLLDADHHFPYALVTSVDLYETLLKNVTESPVLELEQVNKLCEDGVFWSPQIPASPFIGDIHGDRNALEWALAVTQDVDLRVSLGDIV